MEKKGMKEEFHKIIILGCGPSSLSAAIQLVRADVPVLLITEEIGGLIKNANLIENLLGFSKGITGKEMVSIMQNTIEKYQIPLIKEKFLEVKADNAQFMIKTNKQNYTCEYLLIGSGTVPNTLQIPGEEEAYSKNLLWYELSEFLADREKMKIGIIGGGDAAYDYALNLERKNSDIEILQSSIMSTALPLLVQRVNAKLNIAISSEVSVREIKVKSDSVEMAIHTPSGMISKNYDYIFVTIGRSPNISFLSPELKEIYSDQLNNAPLSDNTKENIHKKIWFIGDVKNQKYRQLAIAMGDGIKAAMQLTAMFHN